MFPRVLLALPFLVLPAVTMAEGHDALVDTLIEELQVSDLLDVMAAEGRAYGTEMAQSLFPDNADAPQWPVMVEQIYDMDAMMARVRRDLGTALDGADMEAITAFFATDLGQKAVGLEISARRAMLDDSVDQAARDSAELARLDNTPRYQQVTRFIEVNDLIESNVMGGMNSNYAFYLGLMDGGALDPAVTQDQLLGDVWGQEADVRASTVEWIYSFLMLAYQPLTDDELDAYIAFSGTAAGQQFNRALFVGFDGMFDDISHALGIAGAQFMTGSRL